MATEAVKWFPLDVHMDDSIELIEAEFGMVGFSVIIKLYQRIYGGSGYYCNWCDDVGLLFAKKNGLELAELNKIVVAAIRRDIFDSELYEKHAILTSKGIQERYFNAIKRRKNTDINLEYILIELDDCKQDVNIFEENVYISDENVCNFQQRREEESIVENKKEENSIEKESIAEENTGENTNAALDYYKSTLNPNPSACTGADISSYLRKGMDEACIISIIDYCIDRDRTSWDYIRACIKGNYDDGVRTVEDFRRNHGQYTPSAQKREETAMNNNTTKPASQSYTKPKSTFHNFEHRSINYRDVEQEAFDTLHNSDYSDEELEMIKNGDAFEVIKRRKEAKERAEPGL